MGQVYTCPSCAKKIEDGQDWSLIEKQGDVEIRAHAGRCAMRATLSQGTAEARPWRRDAEEEAIDTTLGLPSPEILDSYLRRLTFPGSVTLALLAGWLGTGRLHGVDDVLD